MRVYISKSERETESIGERILKEFSNYRIFLFEGELGTGKTVMIRGMVKSLGLKVRVSSPSFVMVKEYRNEETCVFHIDLYRIESDYESIDLYDMLNSSCFLFIEWGEKVKALLKDIPHVHIRIKDINIKERRIEVEDSGH